MELEKIETGLAEIAKLDDLVAEREQYAAKCSSRLWAERKRLKQDLEEATAATGQEKVREVSRLLDAGLLDAKSDLAPSMCSRSRAGSSSSSVGGVSSAAGGAGASVSSVGGGVNRGGRLGSTMTASSERGGAPSEGGGPLESEFGGASTWTNGSDDSGCAWDKWNTSSSSSSQKFPEKIRKTTVDTIPEDSIPEGISEGTTNNSLEAPRWTRGGIGSEAARGGGSTGSRDSGLSAGRRVHGAVAGSGGGLATESRGKTTSSSSTFGDGTSRGGGSKNSSKSSTAGSREESTMSSTSTTTMGGEKIEVEHPARQAIIRIPAAGKIPSPKTTRFSRSPTGTTLSSTTFSRARLHCLRTIIRVKVRQRPACRRGRLRGAQPF